MFLNVTLDTACFATILTIARHVRRCKKPVLSKLHEKLHRVTGHLASQ